MTRSQHQYRKEEAPEASSTPPSETGPAPLPLPCLQPAGGKCGACARFTDFYKAWGECHSPEVKAFEIRRQPPSYRENLMTRRDADGRPYHETFLPIRHREDGCRYFERTW